MKITFKKTLAALTALFTLLCILPTGVITAEGGIPVEGEHLPKVNPRSNASEDEPPAPTVLDNALNIPGGTLHFENDEVYPWEIVEDYVKSTNHEDGSEAIITTSVNYTEDMALQFNYSVESEEYCDGIKVYIDGEHTGDFLSGRRSDEWYTYICPLPAGEHTVGISYRKDESEWDGEDTAWLDNVSIAPKIPVESVTINPESVIINGSDEETISVTILPENATFKDVEWDCSDYSVVAFSDSYENCTLIYGVGSGTATITATVGGVSASCEVTVLPVELEGISIDPDELTIDGSDYAYITLITEPSNAFYDEAEWSSSDTSVVDIDGFGSNGVEIRSVGAGAAAVTVTVDGFSASCKVTVLPAELQGISLDPAELTIEGSGYEYIYLNTEPWNAFHGEVEWSSSDTSIVDLGFIYSSDTSIRSVGIGTATITAAVDGFSASCKVTVLPVAPENIYLPDKTAILISEPTEIYARFEPQNALADWSELEWRSSDTSIVDFGERIDESIELVGKKTGTATISVTLNGLTAECEVTVIESCVTVGVPDFIYGDWLPENPYVTDKAIIQLTDDCQTVVTDKSGNYIINPAVAEEHSREEAANGNVTYTFKLKKDLVFNNGEHIKAENFLIWTLFANSSAGEYLGIPGNWDNIFGGSEYNSGEVNYLSGLRLIDDYTFSVTVNAEMFPYYYEISYFNMKAVNIPYWFGDYDWHVKDDGEGAYIECGSNPDFPFTVENISDAFDNAAYSQGDRVTAGAYNLIYLDFDSDQAILQINENYNGNFEGRKPTIQQIVIKYVPEYEALDALANGEIDFYPKITSGGAINAALELIENGEFDGDYCQVDRAGYGFIGFACDFGPTQWTEFRQAVAYLIDRSEFADTFCEGRCFKVDGPYATAFKMYQDSKDWIDENLNPYDYNPEKAVELLKEIGFTLNADGTDYVDGSGKLRYKEVTAEEAKYYGDDNLGWNITLADGRILMPAKINWCSDKNNEVSELLAVMLADSDAAKNAGIEIIKTEMDFGTLTNWLYRGFGDPDYATPTYNMFNLAANWSKAVYDASYSWTSDPEYLAYGCNVNFLYDEELDRLSMDMVYAVEPGDYESYLNIWRQYIDRWNELLPKVPLCSNIYVTVYPNTITNYQETAFWGWDRALLYADWIKPGDYDCDGKITVQDAIMTLRAAMNLITPSEQSLLNADMDGNGTLTVTDAILALRMAMGLIQ